MFNMENVGRKIAELRKNHNMTQLELADKMGISFQAVSNWERGNSMPDIAKLPELAELFGVTVDDLLGEHSEFVESAVKGDIKGYLKNNTMSLGELSNIARKASERGEYDDLDRVLPFADKDVINDIARKMISEDKNIEDIAPFVSKDIIIELAEMLYQKSGIRAVEDIAPFLDKNMLAEYVKEKYL